MNTTTKFGLAGLFAALLVSVTTTAQGNGQGNNPPGNQVLLTYLQSLPVQALDAGETALLVHMREEEKLARDVYRTLNQQWSLPVFANIADSEQNHMDLVLWAMQRYQVQDPVPSNQVGSFNNPLFTQLFQLATTIGSLSPIHAMLVGAIIEDLDIDDLAYALGQTDNRDVDTVWQNLQLGSRNHMRAFYSQLANANVTYAGLFLTPAEVQAIVTTPRETGAVDENGVPLP
jgi:hypothetical protein